MTEGLPQDDGALLMETRLGSFDRSPGPTGIPGSRQSAGVAPARRGGASAVYFAEGNETPGGGRCDRRTQDGEPQSQPPPTLERPEYPQHRAWTVG